MADIKEFLAGYDKEPIRIMEICGTHTAEISRNGIPALLSDKIELISGPGCPVCVTVTQYIDRLCEISLMPDMHVVTFGDMLRVPGSNGSLNDARAQGGIVHMVYSPMEMLDMAKANPKITYVFAAVGFETTTPVYAMLIKKAREEGINNVRLLTSLKTMPAVVDWLCSGICRVDGFLAPGHVCTITGTKEFERLAHKYNIPFVVAGFTGELLLAALYALVKERGRGIVRNLYPSAVNEQGNETAQSIVDEVFVQCDAAWRGIGIIKASGMCLRDEYADYDMGSSMLINDEGVNKACCCDRILTGQMKPFQCPLYGSVCTPVNPQGACMVSSEGSCHNYLINSRH